MSYLSLSAYTNNYALTSVITTRLQINDAIAIWQLICSTVTENWLLLCLNMMAWLHQKSLRYGFVNNAVVRLSYLFCLF